jgi:hypothetical protein
MRLELLRLIIIPEKQEIKNFRNMYGGLSTIVVSTFITYLRLHVNLISIIGTNLVVSFVSKRQCFEIIILGI